MFPVKKSFRGVEGKHIMVMHLNAHVRVAHHLLALHLGIWDWGGCWNREVDAGQPLGIMELIGHLRMMYG